jgi:hypothetical protein
MAGLVRRIVLCAMLIFFTDNMLSAETVTLSTIMPASASGVKRVWQDVETLTGSAGVPGSRGTYTKYFTAPNQPKKDKTVITVAGGGRNSSYSGREGFYFYFNWFFRLESINTSGDYITSFTISTPEVGQSGIATYTVVEYL